jgi:protein-S-isoprenylcysteine O-methyltransferase Ste14
MTTTWIALLVLWFLWWASWLLASRWSGRTEKQLSVQEEMRHRIFMVAGIILLLLPVGGLQEATRVWSVGEPLGWVLFVLAALGFGICWWARLHLGALWSGRVTRKEGHRVVDTGPYAFVRHPIYTGIILAALATAAERGTVLAIAGAALIIVSLSVKARMEEGFLRQELGAEAYDSYAHRVPMLVPFLPSRD